MFKPLVSAVLALLIAVPGLLFAATPVNVNTADASDIAKALDRIGPAKAEAIVAYREAHGPFKKVEDLGHVKGIGKSIIALNRSAILLSDDSAAASPAPEAAADPAAAPATSGKSVHKARKKAAVATDSE
jgi:competence protein ComEA